MCAQMIAGNNRKEIDDDEKLESGRARLFFLFFFFSHPAIANTWKPAVPFDLFNEQAEKQSQFSLNYYYWHEYALEM